MHSTPDNCKEDTESLKSPAKDFLLANEFPPPHICCKNRRYPLKCSTSTEKVSLLSEVHNQQLQTCTLKREPIISLRVCSQELNTTSMIPQFTQRNTQQSALGRSGELSPFTDGLFRWHRCGSATCGVQARSGDRCALCRMSRETCLTWPCGPS